MTRPLLCLPASCSPCSRYLTAIQLTSQHLLRYLAVAVVVNKRRRNVLNDLKRVVSQEAYEYRCARGTTGDVGVGSSEGPVALNSIPTCTPPPR